MRANAANGPMQGGRGGGKSMSTTLSVSGATRSSALPPQRPSQSSGPASRAQTRVSALPSLPRSRHALKRSSDAAGLASVAARETVCDQSLPSDIASLSDGPVPCGEDEPVPAEAVATTKRRDWTCPICGFWTGIKKHWASLKKDHIRSWHPDMASQLSLNPRLPKLIPYCKDKCSWKCPLCEFGTPNDVTDLDTLRRMRLAHAKEVHPRAATKRFLLKRGSARNAQRATSAKTSAGNAKKLLDLKCGKQGPHDCEILQLPYTGQGKKRRLFVNKIFCKTCTALSHSAEAMSKLPCEKASKGGPKRALLIARLKQFRPRFAAGGADRQALESVIRKLQPSDSVQEAAPRDHDIVPLLLPGKPPRKFMFCRTCRRVAATQSTIAKAACKGTVTWSPARMKLVRCVEGQIKTAKGRNLQALSELFNVLTGNVASGSRP
eukprot:Skav232945  [mRNA]  locus=scaffold1860:17553:18860:- [translate_table: standard]